MIAGVLGTIAVPVLGISGGFLLPAATRALGGAAILAADRQARRRLAND
jgi:hypothetical protein